MNVLMYHSISAASGPSNIRLETFREQIEILAVCGYEAISLAVFKARQAGEADLPARPILITFDDGFANSVESAFPVLKAYGYTATVFWPSGRMGQTETWDGSDRSARRLMSWSQAADLAKENIEFGGHSVTHVDLTKLPFEELEREIRLCLDEIGQRLGRAPAAFAPPYGRSGERERCEIGKWFELSFGTRLARCTRADDRLQIPRIDMHYFRDPVRWRKYLEGSGESYFRIRQALRTLKSWATS